MDSHLRHRSYLIYHDGHEWVAEPEAAEPQDADAPIFEMGSSSVDRLIAAIDQIWAAGSDRAKWPVWYRDWMDQPHGGRIALPEIKVLPRTYVKTQEIRVTNVTVDNNRNIEKAGQDPFIHSKFESKLNSVDVNTIPAFLLLRMASRKLEMSSIDARLVMKSMFHQDIKTTNILTLGGSRFG